jgi:hypothetical protein
VADSDPFSAFTSLGTDAIAGIEQQQSFQKEQQLAAENRQLWADYNPTDPVDQATMAKEQGNYDNILATIRNGGMSDADRANVDAILAKTDANAKQNSEGAKERGEATNTATGTAGLVADMMAEKAASDEAATQGAQVAGAAVTNKSNLEATASQAGSAIQSELTSGNESEKNQEITKIGGMAQANELAAGIQANNPMPGAVTAVGQGARAAAGSLNQPWSDYTSQPLSFQAGMDQIGAKATNPNDVGSFDVPGPP